MRYLLAASFLLALILTSFPIEDAVAGEGSFSLQVPLGENLQEIDGTLSNAQIDSSNQTTADMSIDTRLPVGFTSIFVTATGKWIGIRHGSNLEGSITGRGEIDAGALGKAKLRFSGAWEGPINVQGAASGNLSAKILVVESSILQAPAGKQINVTAGSWSAAFDMPAATEVSEISSLMATSFTTATEIASPAATTQIQSSTPNLGLQFLGIGVLVAAAGIGLAYYFRRKRA